MFDKMIISRDASLLFVYRNTLKLNIIAIGARSAFIIGLLKLVFTVCWVTEYKDGACLPHCGILKPVHAREEEKDLLVPRKQRLFVPNGVYHVYCRIS